MLHVLIVEDSPTVAMMTAAFLRSLNVTTTTASTLMEAEDKVHRHHYDLVVLDLNLPDSPADETVARWQEVAGDTPFVVLTGSADKNTRQAALARGVVAVIEKGPQQDTGLRLAVQAAQNYVQQNIDLVGHMAERVERYLAHV